MVSVAAQNVNIWNGINRSIGSATALDSEQCIHVVVLIAFYVDSSELIPVKLCALREAINGKTEDFNERMAKESTTHAEDNKKITTLRHSKSCTLTGLASPFTRQLRKRLTIYGA